MRHIAHLIVHVGKVAIHRKAQIGHAKDEKHKQLYDGIFHFGPILTGTEKKTELKIIFFQSARRRQRTHHNDGGNVSGDQRINTTRRSGQEYARRRYRGAHRSGRNTSHIDQGDAPPTMHQFEGDAKEDLNDQIHHDVHDANVNEHVRDKAPGFVASERIVNEQHGRRSIGTFANFFIVMQFVRFVSVRVRKRRLIKFDLLRCKTKCLLEIDDVHEKHDDFND